MHLSVAHDSQYQRILCSRVLLEELPVRRFIIMLVTSCNLSCPVQTNPVRFLPNIYFRSTILILLSQVHASVRTLSLSLSLFDFPHHNLKAPLLSLSPYLSEQTQGTVLKTTSTRLVLLMQMQCVLRDEETELSQMT